MATVQQIINRAYAKVNGEAESVAPGSADFTTYLNALNEAVQVWYETPYTKWQTTFNPAYELAATVADGTLEYAVADPHDFRLANSPFDSVFFMNGDVIVKRYKMTDQALFQATTSKEAVALFGGTLYLKDTPEEIVGTSIRLPVYQRPALYTSPTETVTIDSDVWLVQYISASICDASPVPFIARNADKYYSQAEISMKQMKQDNRHRQHLVIKQARQNIDDQRFSSLSSAINAGAGAGGGDLGTVDGGAF